MCTCLAPLHFQFLLLKWSKYIQFVHFKQPQIVLNVPALKYQCWAIFISCAIVSVIEHNTMWHATSYQHGMIISYQMEWECHTRWNGNVIPMWYGNVIPAGMGMLYQCGMGFLGIPYQAIPRNPGMRWHGIGKRWIWYEVSIPWYHGIDMALIYHPWNGYPKSKNWTTS